jgi:glycosyltransferase involved in cell wall biosynthesis
VWPPPALGFSYALAKELRREASPDIYHIHGVWHLAQLAGCREARRRGRPYIYELMGGFTAYELRRKLLKKRIARWLYQDATIRDADCLHVNGESEAAFLRSQGFRNAIVVLPVGVKVRQSNGTVQAEVPYVVEAIRHWRVLLYLARIHPTKGIDILIDAWRALAARFPDWILVVAGAGESSYVVGVKAKLKQAGLAGKVIFTGLVTEEQKAWCYQNASIYVLPSLQENFGNTVAEALSYGVPVITTTQTPWAELTTAQCGWLCEPTSQELCRVLLEAMSLVPAELKQRGIEGKRLVEEKYSLDSVIVRLDHVYQWLLGAEKPGFIHLG